MRGVWSILYSYVKRRATRACFQNQYYRENHTYGQIHLIWLREHLDPEALTHINDAWEMTQTAVTIQQEYLVRTALETGILLGSAGYKE